MAVRSWEDPLLALAYEAFSSPRLRDWVKPDHSTLDNAYHYCASVTRANSRTFFLAARLLPQEKRRAAHALYAFCRSTDDLIDKAEVAQDRHTLLDDWRRRLTSVDPTAYDPVPLAWADAQAHFGIPHGYAVQLFDGIARDLVQTRYETFDELTEYCYGVASTVGLMVMHIVNFSSEAALPYAVKLGIALQLTNILRDVGEDYRMGRLYLPLEELAAFGLREADVAAGCVDDRWRQFMRFQIKRTHDLYHEAQPGIALLNADGRFAIAAAAALYRGILDDIEAHDYDVFGRRAHVTGFGKLRRLPGIWLNSKQL